MKQNYKVFPLDISSNYSRRYTIEVSNTTTNRSTNNHITYDNRSNIYVQNDYNPFKKYTNNLIYSKNKELYPSINGEAIQNDYYDRQNYNNDRYSESNDNRENLLSPNNRSYINNKNFFNGNQNKYQNNNYYDNNNDMDRSRGNYTYYESKYSRKKSIERDNNFNNNKVNEIVYYNENYNISNISEKNSKYESNYNIKTNPDNSNIKKRKNNTIYSKMQNAKLVISSNSNINDTTDKLKNSCNNPNSNNNHLDISKDSYHSPVKTVTVEKGTYNVHDKNNYSRNENNVSSKSSDKIQINEDILKIKNEIKNKKIEMIKLNKSNLIGLKKTSNIKKIPFSPSDINNSLNNNKTLNLIKEKKEKMKNNYSYSEIKNKENKNIFQTDNPEIKVKKDLCTIKGVKLTNNKLFKKSISSYIGQPKINPNSNRNKNNINKIIPTSLDNDDNNNLINISHSSHSKNKDNEETGKRHKIVISNLKREKAGVINDDKDNQFMRRLHSHQKLNIYPEINNDKFKPESSKTITTIKNNLVKSNVIGRNQRFTNDNILNQKSNNDYYKNNKNSVLNSIINNKYNKYNNYTEVKKSIKNKGNNILHSIALNRIKPTKLDNTHLSTLNPNNINLRRIIKTPMTLQMQTKEKLKSSENDEEDNWDDFEYLGLRKRTYDIGQRRRKNRRNSANLIKHTFMNSELNSQTSFIKSCESLSIPGRNDEGNKKINQDSYISERNINGITNFNIFGVLDGHGENGHYASQFVSRYMISHIKNHPLIKKCENAKEVYEILKNKGYEIIAKLYLDADIQITKEKFDCKNSGTTCVIVIQLEDKIICSNAGDSRAILIYDKNNNTLKNTKIYPLSFDCKPNLPNEKKRILECGGFVGKAFDQYDDQEEGPFRVFEKGEDYPGIAISRSIGDMDAKKIGVIPNPQIIEYNIDNNTKYMLICSDGIWEYISNEDVMRIGNKFYLKNDAKGLCHELYKKSLDLWLQDDVCVDDITVIAVFF